MKTAPSLKVLAESKTEGITKVTSFQLDPNLIKFEPGFNLREEGPELDAHIERLYLAMLAGAFIPPVDVSVVEGVVIARDGHCRTRAAIRVREEMPEYVLQCRQLRGNELDAVLHMLGTGSGSRPLSPLEQGRGYLRLINMGMKVGDIAARLGVSRGTVDGGLILAEAPLDVQRMVINGEVSGSAAKEAVRAGTEGVKALTEAVEKQRAEPKKKKVTAKHLKGTAAGKKAPTPQPAEVMYNADEVTVSIPRNLTKMIALCLRGSDSEELQNLASTFDDA